MFKAELLEAKHISSQCFRGCSNHEASFFHGFVNLANSVDEACISEGKILLYGKFPVLSRGCNHDFFESGVDNIELVSSLNIGLGVFDSHKVEESGLGFLLVLLGQSSWGDVIKILKPFEVGAGNTTTIDKHVWGSDDSLALEDLMSLESSWTISSLEDGLDLDVSIVSSVDGLLCSSWDHAVSSEFG